MSFVELLKKKEHKETIKFLKIVINYVLSISLSSAKNFKQINSLFSYKKDI